MRKNITKAICFGVTMWVAGAVTGIGLGVIISQRGDRR